MTGGFSPEAMGPERSGTRKKKNCQLRFLNLSKNTNQRKFMAIMAMRSILTAQGTLKSCLKRTERMEEGNLEH